MLQKLIKNINLLRPVLVILLLAIPLYPKFPLYNFTETYVAVRLEDILIVIGLLFLFIYQIKYRFPLLKLPVTKLFIAYFVAIFASTVTAILVFKTDSTQILLLHFFRRLEYMSLFFLAAATISHKKDLIPPTIAAFIAMIGVTLYGYGQKYWQFPVVSTMNEEFSKGHILSLTTWTRINSTFAGHYDLAAYLSAILIITLGLIIFIKKPILKIPLLFSWLASFQILTYTASRVSIFAFWGGMIVALLLIKKYLWIIPISLLIIFSLLNSKELNQRLLATISTIKIFTPTTTHISPSPTFIPTPTTPPVAVILTPGAPKPSPLPTVIRHAAPEEYPVVDVDAGVSRSGEIRFNVEWPRAINAFRKNPLVGTGLGSITLATDNDYLRSLGESGLFGYISFIGIILYFIYHTFTKTRNQYTFIIFAAVLTTMVNAIFIDVFEASKTAYLFWIMMGIYHQTLHFTKSND